MRWNLCNNTPPSSSSHHIQVTAALSAAAGPSTCMPLLPGHQTSYHSAKIPTSHNRTSANIGMTQQEHQKQLEHMMKSVGLDHSPPQIGNGNVLGTSQQGIMISAHHQRMYPDAHMVSRNQSQLPTKVVMSSGQPDFAQAQLPSLTHLHTALPQRRPGGVLLQLGLLGDRMVPKLGPAGHCCIPTSFETPVFKLFLPPSSEKAALQWWILDLGKVHGPFSSEQMIIGYIQKVVSDSVSVTGVSDDGLQPVSLPALTAFLPLGPLLQSVGRGLSYKPQSSHSPLADKNPT